MFTNKSNQYYPNFPLMALSEEWMLYLVGITEEQNNLIPE